MPEWSQRARTVILRLLSASLAAAILSGCRAAGFRAVGEDIFSRRIVFKNAPGGGDGPEAAPRRITVSADSYFGSAAANGIGSAAAMKAIRLDGAGKFAEAYEVLKSDGSPICKALLANYERYSRPGLYGRTSRRRAEALCREVVAETGEGASGDDLVARREACRLLPFHDYAGLAANAKKAGLKPDQKWIRNDLFYDGGPFAAQFLPPPHSWKEPPPPPAVLRGRMRDAAIRGNERARRAFGEDGEITTELSDYRLAGLAHWKRYPYLPLEGAPGFGLPGEIAPYGASPQLQEKAAEFGLECHWFIRGVPLEGDPALAEYRRKASNDRDSVFNHLPVGFSCSDCTPSRIPFMLRRGNGRRRLPLVIYMPGNGEQGTNLLKQFRQTAVMRKVSSPEFQRSHPCHLLVPMPPSYGNMNMAHGYPEETGGELTDLYCDLVFQLMREGLAVDRSRIYLVGLGSGGVAALAMERDHPGRFAAVCSMWDWPSTPVVHPLRPGSWWNGRPKDQEGIKELEKNVGDAEAIRRAGGDFVMEFYPPPPGGKGWWWDPPWQGDRFWEWLFSKTTKGEVYR